MTIVGIDLGTTNSLVGVWRDGAAVLIPNALGRFLTPSVVGIDDKGEVLVGQAARERLVTHPHHTAAAFKRYMGTNKAFYLGPRPFRAEELSSLVLRSLKADAEAFLGETVTQAIVTVPAYFNDAQRKATKVAGEMAGLKVELLLTEPTAAALAYGFVQGEDDAHILILDLGGGTLDVSLVHSFEGIMEVKAAAGDIWLGGEDFTDAIVGEFMAVVGKKAGIDKAPGGDPVHGSLRRQADAAKCRLSEADSAAIEVVFGQEQISWTINRSRFEELSEPLLARVRLPLERALRDARIAPEDLTRIVYAGGATRMPAFRRMISRLFRQLPLQHINPDEVVARGAAVRAGLIAGGSGLEEHVLTDVAPFTLGIEVSAMAERNTRVEGVFAPIIERNTVIPVSRSEVFNTVADNQRHVDLKIYQGEARFVRDNVLLGSISIAVPPGPAGKERIDVRFSYDSSGLLEVDVTVLSNGRKEHLLIEGNPGVLNAVEIQERLKMLAGLKIHPRDETENMALLTRANRLYEEHLGDARQYIGQIIDRFTACLERQNRDEIAEMRRETAALLEQFDRSSLS